MLIIIMVTAPNMCAEHGEHEPCLEREAEDGVRHQVHSLASEIQRTHLGHAYPLREDHDSRS